MCIYIENEFAPAGLLAEAIVFFSSKNCFSPIAFLLCESIFASSETIYDLLTAMVAEND
jgi:hypothetical protein